jgi:hypothetical protein
MMAWQVHNLLALYDEVEVPRDRLLFKIPATWQVCFILNGIYKYIFVDWCTSGAGIQFLLKVMHFGGNFYKMGVAGDRGNKATGS